MGIKRKVGCEKIEIKSDQLSVIRERKHNNEMKWNGMEWNRMKRKEQRCTGQTE
jgi:hypothetical protein